jgi:hypothetical protein
MSKFISKPSAPAAAAPLSSPHTFDRTRTHKKQFILHEKTIHTSLHRGRIKKFTSECIWSFTRTNQAFFSSRRALLIQRVVKVLFFRFGGVPDWLGWWLLGEWSGHWPVLSWLARRALTTLVALTYLGWPSSVLEPSVMSILTACCYAV